MTFKKTLLSFCAVALALGIALAGIWYNYQHLALQNGGVLTAEAASCGVFLTGWEETSPGGWKFSFTAAPEVGELILYQANSAGFLAEEPLTSRDDSNELYDLSPTASGTITLWVNSSRTPQSWVVSRPVAMRGFHFRTTLQWMALTAFFTIAAVVLALYYYKHQRELGYFLLYLAVLMVWGFFVFVSPLHRDGWLGLLMRVFFSLTVLAPIWLCSALTGVGPKTQHQKLLSVGLTIAYLLLTLTPLPRVRAVGLFSGMIYCMGLLFAAYLGGSNSALLLLFPCAVTVGLRVWVILPGMDVPFFPESYWFYLLRCARIYDVPFTLGCMTFVCRRFALQFDRTEQLAQELDQRVIERTRALTEETEARKSMMLNIFHDLRSPLFAVSSGLDTLEAAPEALPALLPALQQRIEFLRRLTEDLFLAAKLEQKQVMLNEDRVSLSEAAMAVCESCQSEAEAKGVQLTTSFEAELPVWGDQMRLQQILQNLLTNAIHYTPAGGCITLRSFTEGTSALVSVQDTGCGIAPEDQTAVFDRYFHTTANTKHDSTGLGLTIAQELAHLHHGEILLESEVGKGSCFTLMLPLLSDDDSES